MRTAAERGRYLPRAAHPPAIAELKKELAREILLSFWKVHILHHAAEEPVVGQWMLEELRRHGYEVSPGTLYPVLKRLEARGWLRCRVDPAGGKRARREYFLTARGRRALDLVNVYLAELTEEVSP
jgi:DNA-binding PadR family transcriptional regulator